MTGRRVACARLATMDAAELGWRSRDAGRDGDRSRCARRSSPPAWNRAQLVERARAASRRWRRRTPRSPRRDWHAAHASCRATSCVASPQRFVLGPTSARRSLSDASRATSRTASGVRRAATRLDPRRRLRPARLRGASVTAVGAADWRRSAIDWHFDPVHGRRAPLTFWADVPYLDPDRGDHKIIWELNRHQHWLALGRAFWLTGDERYRDRVRRASSRAGSTPIRRSSGINWASMLELAFRSISWVWALNFFVDGPTPRRRRAVARRSADGARPPARRTSSSNLSYYFSPNTHLLGEALALYVTAARFPELRAQRPARGARPRRSCRRDRPPDRRRRRALRAVDALPPLHARLLPARAGGRRASDRRPGGDPVFEDAVGAPGFCRTPAGRRPRPPSAHRRRRRRID